MGTLIQMGATLWAAMKASGRDRTAPITVPIQAMYTDSKTLPTAPRAATLANAGGIICRRIAHASDGAPSRRSRVTSNPDIDQTMATNRTTPMAPRRSPVHRGGAGLCVVAVISDQPLPEGHAHLLDDPDHHEDDHEHPQYPVEAEELALCLQHTTDAAGADQAEDDRCADVQFEDVEGMSHVVGKHRWKNAGAQ